MAKVEHEREICIGCGACAAVYPEGWEMADDGQSTLKNSTEAREGIWEKNAEEEEASKHQEAAESCPVGCIRVKN